jgi:hypothetical protein
MQTQARKSQRGQSSRCYPIVAGLGEITGIFKQFHTFTVPPNILNLPVYEAIRRAMSLAMNYKNNSIMLRPAIT